VTAVSAASSEKQATLAGGGEEDGMRFLVRLEQGEDGYVVAECPALPGCVSQGKTPDEALANIREAIQGIVTVRRKHGLPIPEERLVEVEVSA
jgi:predicted RNase H-like HicB family nuclease